MTKQRKDGFRPFEPGEVVTNVRILSVERLTNAQITTEYVVEHLCCHDRVIMRHKRLRERLADGAEVCLKCNRKAIVARETETEKTSRRKKRLAAQIAETLKPGIMGWAPPPSAVQRGRS